MIRRPEKKYPNGRTDWVIWILLSQASKIYFSEATPARERLNSCRGLSVFKMPV